ncbi:DNA polymerase III, chi subunit [Faunimonas pinastri]|uniref:DNA polymerase III, chi subunit n=1 Tax=Faunimonas pinastri TaxID=1855383 RepID=A0A1H9D1L3_9HYPH|nr:DNA polymerase III subunit chi [Faunimonas pinastri]SEQ06648.1 DNA polymerase III, chi subunit [Faunimonas pinastri]
MAEVLFYHLERVPLERVLPDLLARSLQRGWNVGIQVGSDERLQVLDGHLWTFDDSSFLPHGTSADGHAELQPIWLTTGSDNPNAAQVRFFVDGARPEAFEGYERFVFLFDGGDAEGIQLARTSWKEAKAVGCDVTYWRQDEDGRWRKAG